MNAESQKSGKCCCGKPALPRQDADGLSQPVADPSVWSAPWVVGRMVTPAGDVPQLSTGLTWRDRLGGWKVRWAIGRMAYRVSPGLYAVGNPTDESPILVTANYKLTFDDLRSQLDGRDAWLLVLDTNGVNVWCAAAKGTLGTDELVRRIGMTGVRAVVSHDMLILPQLAAVGVSAHDVRKASGFRVVFGPIYAADLPRFLEAGFKSPEMHRVRFSLKDRLVLVPVELVQWMTKAFVGAACLMLLAGLGADGFALERLASVGVPSAAMLLIVVALAVTLGPTLLPWLPGRAFSVKGAWLGLLLAVVVALACGLMAGGMLGVLDLAAWCLAIPTITSFTLMGFTGSTPYTSLSGVRREVRMAVPPQLAAAAVAIVLFVVGRFV